MDLQKVDNFPRSETRLMSENFKLAQTSMSPSRINCHFRRGAHSMGIFLLAIQLTGRKTSPLEHLPAKDDTVDSVVCHHIF